MDSGNTGQKVNPSDEQRAILRRYREQHMMISTTQHELIERCHVETGLPVTYIKGWIGNQNADARGTRKGGDHYKPRGKPRKISGYNIFCSENKAPENIRSKGLGAQNKWWQAEWLKLGESERAIYKERAAEANKRSATHALIGEDIIYRQNYLLTKLSKLCEEMGEAGIHVAAFAAQDDDEEIISGSSLGMKFLKSRRAQTTRVGEQLRQFVKHSKQKQMQKTSTKEKKSPSSAIGSQSRASPSTNEADSQNSNPNISAQLQSEHQRKKKRVTRKKKVLAAANPPPVEAIEIEPDASLSNASKHQHKTKQVARKVSGKVPVGRGVSTVSPMSHALIVPAQAQSETNPLPVPEQVQLPPETALQILLPLSNGITLGTGNEVSGATDATDEPLMNTAVFTIATADLSVMDVDGEIGNADAEIGTADVPVKNCKVEKRANYGQRRKTSKRKRTSEDIVGKEIEHLWITEDSPYKRWYQGSVVERDGDIYRMKYEGEKDLYPFPVSTIKKWIKAKTFLVFE